MRFTLLYLWAFLYPFYDTLPETPLPSSFLQENSESSQLDVLFCVQSYYPLNSAAIDVEDLQTRWLALLDSLVTQYSSVRVSFLSPQNHIPFTNDTEVIRQILLKPAFPGDSIPFKNLIPLLENETWRKDSQKLLVSVQDRNSNMEQYSNQFASLKEMNVDMYTIISGKKIKRLNSIENTPAVLIPASQLPSMNKLILQACRTKGDLNSKYEILFDLLNISPLLIHEMKLLCKQDLYCQLDLALQNVQKNDNSTVPRWTPKLIVDILRDQPVSRNICKVFNVLCLPSKFEIRPMTGLLQSHSEKAMQLLSVDIHSTIMENHASTQLTQLFVTQEKSDYVFVHPLHHDATVSAFVIRYGDVTISSNIETSMKAQNIFDRATNDDEDHEKTAFLLTQSSDRTSKEFRMEMGNLPQFTDIEIKVSIIQDLAIRSGENENERYESHTFFLPAVTNRFSDSEENEDSTLEVTHSFSLIPLYSFVNFTSCSHPVAISNIKTSSITASYQTSDIQLLKKDFLMTILYEKIRNPGEIDFYLSVSNNPVMQQSKQHESSALELQIPLLFDPVLPYDRGVIVVLDVSHSMKFIFPEIVPALVASMEVLVERNVPLTLCTFATDAQCWNLGPLDSVIISKVRDYLLSIEPAGGSNLYKVAEILEWMANPKSDILFVSDGESLFITEVNQSNFEGVRQWQTLLDSLSLRLFPVIINDKIESRNLNTIAQKSGGHLERATSGTSFGKNDISIALSKQVNRFFQQSIIDVEIRWIFADFGGDAGLLMGEQEEIDSIKHATLFSGDMLHIKHLLLPFSELDCEPFSDFYVSISGKKFNGQKNERYERRILVDLENLPIHGQCEVGKFGPLCTSMSYKHSILMQKSIANHLLQETLSPLWQEKLGLRFALASPQTAFIGTHPMLNQQESHHPVSGSSQFTFPFSAFIFCFFSITILTMISPVAWHFSFQ